MIPQIINAAIFQTRLFAPKALADVGPIKLDSYVRFDSIPAVISSILQILMLIIMVLAVIYLILGGYQYVTAGGDPEAAIKARNTIVGSVIGLIVAFASYIIVKYIFESLA